MEFNQLRYFITAAQFQNLSKAASVLHITQPALSKSISKLEDELGVRLFDRSGKKVTINEDGERFLEYAINSIQGIDDAVAAVNNQAPSPALYIGMFHHSRKFLHCIGDYSKANPGVSFQVKRLEIESHSIDTNEFDLLLFSQNPLFQKYRGHTIFSDPYLLAVHKSHPLADREAIRLSEIAPYKVVFLKYSSKLYDLPYHICVSLGVRTSDDIFTNNNEIQRWFVSNNHGVGFVPQGDSDTYAADPNIVLIPVSDEGLSREIMIGFKREKHLSPAGKQFAAFVREYFHI